jgi:hypothetical protein
MSFERGSEVKISFDGQSIFGMIRDHDDIGLTIETPSTERYSIEWESISDGTIRLETLKTKPALKKAA